MKRTSSSAWIATVAFFYFLRSFVATPPVWGHCDTLDGPVVLSAREALDAGDVTPVLKWVKKEHASEIRDAFDKTVAVRVKGPAERELADMYFFETLVRIHRAGEGAPYNGLKPAGLDLGPAIPAADKALAEGNAEALTMLITGAVQEGLLAKFKSVLAKKDFKKNDVEAGRAYVEAYVTFVHYVEEVYRAASKSKPDLHEALDHAQLHEEQ
jgi:hypothetical protein